MKIISILTIILSCSTLFSQEIDSAIFEEIYKEGKSYTMPLKNGQIESLRNVKPPKDAWTFSKLEDYKQNLGSENIIYGSIIMPSSNSNSGIYSYNLFAYDIKKASYYFVAIFSFSTSGDDIELRESYLFTENSALNMWWNRVFGFYESETIAKIPKKYLYKTCPPPPY